MASPSCGPRTGCSSAPPASRSAPSSGRPTSFSRDSLTKGDLERQAETCQIGPAVVLRVPKPLDVQQAHRLVVERVRTPVPGPLVQDDRLLEAAVGRRGPPSRSAGLSNELPGRRHHDHAVAVERHQRLACG